MTITNIGFDGTVDEVAFSHLLYIAGGGDTVSSPDAYRVTPAGDGTRRVKVGAGVAFAAGVSQESDESQYVSIPAPSVSGWFLVVLRRNWSDNSVTPVALQGDTTSATTPGPVPTANPATFQTNLGVIYDQKLAWVFTNINTTTFTIVDARKLPAWMPRQGSTAARDYFYGVPDSTPARLALQGAEWFNTEYGYRERYYPSSNDNSAGAWGGAGWYPDIDRHYLDAFQSSGAYNLTLAKRTLDPLPYPTLVTIESLGQGGFRADGGMTFGLSLSSSGFASFQQSDNANVIASAGASWTDINRSAWGILPAGASGVVYTLGQASTASLNGSNTNGYWRGTTKFRRTPYIRPEF